jgi:hypothetical protein
MSDVRKYTAPAKVTGLVKHSEASPNGTLVVPKSWGISDRNAMIRKINNILDVEQVNPVNKNLKHTLRDVVRTASTLTNVPADILLGFIMSESGGFFNSKITDGAGGLVHWKQQFVGGNKKNTPLWKDNAENRLSTKEREFLKKYNIVFDSKGYARPLTNEDVLDPYLNAYIGALILSRYMDDPEIGKGKDGTIRIEKMIARYNMGSQDYDRLIKPNPQYNFNQVYAVVPEVTKRYIAKVLGKDATMDVLHKDFGITNTI